MDGVQKGERYGKAQRRDVKRKAQLVLRLVTYIWAISSSPFSQAFLPRRFLTGLSHTTIHRTRHKRTVLNETIATLNLSLAHRIQPLACDQWLLFNILKTPPKTP